MRATVESILERAVVIGRPHWTPELCALVGRELGRILKASMAATPAAPTGGEPALVGVDAGDGRADDCGADDRRDGDTQSALPVRHLVRQADWALVE